MKWPPSHLFLNRDNFPPVFRKGSVVFWALYVYSIRLRDIILNIPSEHCVIVPDPFWYL
jgi:hypothetical protein